MNIVKSVGNLARRAMSSPALVRRAAFIAPFQGSVLSEVACTGSSVFASTFHVRVANDADEPLFCSIFGETESGLEALDPPEFRVDARTKGNATFAVRRRILRPVRRVIVSMRNGALQYSIDARVPPLSLGNRLRMFGGALTLCSAAVLLSICTHPLLAFGTLPETRVGSTISIPYDAEGIGRAQYEVRNGSRTLATGALANGSGFISFTTLPQPQTYTITMNWSGPFASRDATATLRSSVPPKVEAQPQIRSLEVAQSVVASGDSVLVRYDASANAGVVTLLDAAQIVVAHAAFDRSGVAKLVAPLVDSPTPYRVQLHVTRGNAETNASIGIQIVPKQQAQNQPSGNDLSAVGGIVQIDQAYIIGGQSVHVSLIEHDFPVHVTLQNPSGTAIVDRDVAAGSDGTDLDIPKVATESRYVLVVTFSSGQGQQTMLLPIDVHPS